MRIHKSVTKPMVLLVVVLGAPISMAGMRSECDSDQGDAELSNCSEAVDLEAMNQCRQQGYEDAKAKMQKPLSELLETYAPEEPSLVDRLTKAQQAWGNYIKKDCEYEIYYSSGTQAEAAQRFHCLEGHYRARLNYLKEKLQTP